MGSVDRKELLVRSSFAIMKAFILLALVAAVHAEAEADPALLYAGYYGYPYYYGVAGYYGHNNAGLPAIKAAPCVNAAGAPVPCAGRKRREAEADPQLVTYTNGAVAPVKTLAVQQAEAAHFAAKGLSYAYGVGLPVAPYATYTYGLPLVYGRKRREAESEAEADPAYFYAGYPYYGYPYGGLVHTSHFGVCTNYLGARVPC